MLPELKPEQQNWTNFKDHKLTHRLIALEVRNVAFLMAQF